MRRQSHLSTRNSRSPSPAAGHAHDLTMFPLAAARAHFPSLSLPPKSLPATSPLFLRLPPVPQRRGRPAASLLRPLRAAAASPGASSRPARDRAIDFGKFKGQMLGTLPQSYLRWVVAELDYGDTAAWADLARGVLDDPVYLDRVEWDHAHRFLSGDAKFDYVYDDDDDDDDGPLLEMAERFGWDLSDEDGWSRLDYSLIGTSFGGRIPRKSDRRQSSSSSSSFPRGGRKGSLSGADPDGLKGKRDERRERMRMRRDELVRTAKMGMLGVNAGAKDAGALGTPRKARIGATAKKDILRLGRGRRGGGEVGERAVPGKAGGGGGASPFPGRQSFLDKVRNLKDES